MKRLVVPLVTATDGSGTLYSSAMTGKLYAVLYKPGSLATGTDVTITNEGEGSKPILTLTDAGTSNLWKYPRDLVHAVSDGAALTGTSGGDRALPIVDGKFKIVLAQGGGATNDGKIIFYVEE